MLADINKAVRFQCAIDITSEKKKQKKLEQKLVEKQVLIKEIHHRVKNNNQLLLSLLNMQSMKTRSKVSKQILETTMERIQAISLMYDKLYANKDLSNLNISRYTNDIVDGLSATILNQHNITLKKNIDKNIIIQEINKITPIGLIINELLFNCVKHAFNKQTKQKKIKINLTKNDNVVILTIEDNGVGFPKNYSIKRQETLGTMLIRTLASQLRGKFFYESIKFGTKAILKFKIK